MSEEIFRQKSLDKIKSPESLNDYVRVSNPSVWLLLVSVIALLAGACIWGIFGHIDSTADTEIHVENGTVTCYISEENIADIEKGMRVEFAGYNGVISDIGEKDERGYICTVTADSVPADGTYGGQVVLEQIQPVSFVLN